MNNQSTAKSFKGISRAVLLAVTAFILSITFFASTAFADLVKQYNVEIKIDNESVVVTTNETEAIEILSQANITLAQNDKLDLSNFVEGEGGVISIDRLKNVNIEFDSAINTYSVYADTVGDALNELGITVNGDDKISHDRSANVIDGMIITIHSSKSVSLKVDGKTTKYAIYQGTVRDLLELAQVELGSDDFTKPALDTVLKENMTVAVYRVSYKTVEKAEETAYKTKKTNDSSMTAGKTKTVVKGIKGEDKVTYKVKYVNGKKKEQTEVKRLTVKAPQNAVVKVGTKNSNKVKSNGITSKNGYSVGQKIKGRYTHYCACATCNGNSRGITSSGKKISNGMADPYYVACNWLPLGSVIRVDGKNYTVVDRGGSGLSTVGRIDIFTPEGHKACYKYGTGSCSIEIVRLGW
ncbi:MAG: ubiquitin-like domain-containing protein [Acetobacter sp.]|nr:ubiquitin-like domain-containing protein [Bacteroides sp.]MCM1341214.1 ubiquitin-like domain-containing protein [Acetobacter sp.]MCM1433857.1 ubiquitin-like domain-containing protein [Clostridiales bacterium]